MTREQAILAAATADHPMFNVRRLDFMADAERLVNQLEALGMLKLEEPESDEQKILSDILYNSGGWSRDEIPKLFKFIDEAGLKLVATNSAGK